MTGTYVVAPPANPDVDKVDSMPTDLLGREYETFPAPEPLQQHGPARVIAMCNQKGGVGKTTSSINIAGALAQYGRRVLIVDFDPQGAATVGLGVNANTVENTIYTALFDISVDPHDVVQHTAFENIDVIPANIDLSAAEVQLVTEVGREQILNSVLRKLKSEYDLIIVDAYSSDAIPIHLATEEAMAIYKAKLAPQGAVVMHVSNRHLELASVVVGIADANDMKSWVYSEDSGRDNEYIFSTSVVVSAREDADVGKLASSDVWTETDVDEKQRVWTDDYSNVLGAVYRRLRDGEQ